ncbi:hypothetical protein HDE_02903 [Halotydeus destructor]|nr:hypothetical protein HDE_02903 [Halotydeus destructor]
MTLFEAVQHLKLRQATLLLERDPSLVNQRHHLSKVTPLLTLVSANQAKEPEKELEMARILVSKGADVDAKDSDGKSAILLACERSRRNLVLYLIDVAKADISLQDRVEGRNALMVAAMKGDQRLFGDLLDRCRHDQRILLQRDFSGHSLWQICKDSKFSKECLRTLTEHLLEDFAGIEVHDNGPIRTNEEEVNITSTKTKKEREKWVRETRLWFGRSNDEEIY